MCTSQGAIKRANILDAIKEAAKVAKPSPAGAKCICLYYTGHGSELIGNWCFKGEDGKGGEIDLQDILDCFEPKDFIRLLILSDCCYSGKWARKLKDRKYKVAGNVSLTYYSSCDGDEVAGEKVFTDLLQGHVPDLAGGGDFSVLRDNVDKNIGVDQTLCSWTGKIPQANEGGAMIESKYSHLENYGQFQYASGWYDGQIVNGKPHGQGQWFLPGGNILEGKWHKGQV